jgi:cytochrome P450
MPDTDGLSSGMPISNEAVIAHPLAAVTHADPYAYYARLVERGLYRDEALGLWVAASAEAVSAVLTHPASRVRPPGEPVPAALLGSPAAEVFGRLVRMTDGTRHAALKPAVTATLDGAAITGLTAAADRWAARLAAGIGADDDAAGLTELAFALPAHVLGSGLGLSDDGVTAIAPLVDDLVRGLFPGGTPEQVERGTRAAATLGDRIAAELDAPSGSTGPSLLRSLATHSAARDDRAGVVANAIGFLAQAYDATAALIATTLLTLARQVRPGGTPAATLDALPAFIEEVARFDSPVQNTRRFLAEPAVVAGRELPAEEAVLVLLAAANRDPRANPDPNAFDPARPAPRVFTFGVGPHACPGRLVATSITRAAVARLLLNGVDPARLDVRPAYRPSPNCRMPLLRWRADG